MLLRAVCGKVHPPLIVDQTHCVSLSSFLMVVAMKASLQLGVLHYVDISGCAVNRAGFTIP
jgi:hypothetical protein